MKIVGIDFGHGEISASYLDDACEGVKQLKLINTTSNLEENWKIPSYLYKYKGEGGQDTYSLDEPAEAHALVSELKKPISYMTEEEKVRYREFIRLIYQRLKDCNSELNNNDFKLAIACPTKWLDYQKEEYKEFFNEALSDFGIQIYAIMNESDAAFFAKYEDEDRDKNILVVDYGSSTIDFTLVSKGKKVDLDDMSSSNLGASAIENAVMAIYINDEKSNYQSIDQQVRPILQQRSLSWIDLNRFILAQIREKKEYLFEKQQLYLKRFFYSPWYPTALVEMQDIADYDYNLKQPFMEITIIKEYINKVKDAFEKLKVRTNHECEVNKVIMSGGACMMKWVKEAIMDIFELDENAIEIDRSPAFVVCDGIVKYCQKYQECLDRLKEEIDTINFEKILQESDIDAINTLSEDDIKFEIRCWRNRSDALSIYDLIYRRIPSVFINNFNSHNKAFNRKYNDLMTSKVKTQIEKSIKEIIKDVFRIDITIDSFSYKYTDGAKYAYSEDHRNQIYYYLMTYFENRNSDWSFTYFIEGYDINYLKDRYSNEREEIADNLLSNFSSIFYNFDSKAGISYPSMSNEVIDWYKTIVYQFALELMEEKQLFKTSFSK